MDLNKEIKERVKKELIDAEVLIFDPKNDGVHLEAIVISEQFVGKSLVDQHRLVMKPLKEKFQTSLHALALKTYTPDQWEQR